MRQIRAITFSALLASSAFDAAHSFSGGHHASTISPQQNGLFKSKRHVPGPRLPIAPSQYSPKIKGKLLRTTSTTTCFAMDLSSLATAPATSVTTTANAAIISPQTLATTASAALTYISLIAYFDRPRGYLAIPDAQSTLVKQPSLVPGAGLGLYAACSLPKGTVLGSYAGVLRPAQAFYDGKCRRYPQAVGYSWRFTDDKYVIDPTDAQGNIQDYCLGGSSDVPLSNFIMSTFFGFVGVDTMLCRINEPPRGGGGCSVSAKEDLDKREVVFTLVQDVYQGQELYLDYGLDYDRSRYGGPSAVRIDE